MPNEHLSTYLNDHLAGSIAALELLDHLIESHEGTDISRFLSTLRSEIQQNQASLEDILARLHVGQSSMRKAGAWLAEKVARAKLRLDDRGDKELQLLQGLEGLALGIHGQEALWKALEVLAGQLPELKGIDLPRLEERARRQHDLVEARRLQQVNAALANPSGG